MPSVRNLSDEDLEIREPRNTLGNKGAHDTNPSLSFKKYPEVGPEEKPAGEHVDIQNCIVHQNRGPRSSRSKARVDKLVGRAKTVKTGIDYMATNNVVDSLRITT